MKRSPQLHRIAEFLSGEDKDTKEVQLVYDAKIYPRSRTGVKQILFRDDESCGLLKKEAIFPYGVMVARRALTPRLSGFES